MGVERGAERQGEMRSLPDKPSDATRALNPGVFAQNVINAFCQLPGALIDCEDALQRACEMFLDARGYTRLTAANAMKPPADCKGWYGHLVHAKGNPLLPDLFIHACGRCLLVELKHGQYDYRPGQREMIERGEWRKAESLREFAEIVQAWEDA